MHILPLVRTAQKCVTLWKNEGARRGLVLLLPPFKVSLLSPACEVGIRVG